MAKFIPPFKIGSVLTNEELSKTFKVGNMGGMRRSKTTGTLVIISDHTKGLYDDKWSGDILHYTGMGKVGDQIITGNQNKTLAESDTNGVEVHLFEVLQPKEYIYQGVVKLCDKPYQEDQKDSNNDLRKVWMFPLCSVDKFLSIKDADLKDYLALQKKNAEKMKNDDLKATAEARSLKDPAFRITNSKSYVRDPYIAEYTKRRANGKCELCNNPAPFCTDKGEPYLECHHIVWLSEGGADSIENTAALCPNCHRKMHVLNSPADVKLLLEKAKHRIQA